MIWIKICGTTNLADAFTAAEAGANALGFVFYHKSPRRIDPEAAREIVERLPSHIEKIGVFVNDPVEQILKTVARAGLTGVQLHGAELRHPENIRALKASRELRIFPVLQAEDI